MGLFSSLRSLFSRRLPVSVEPIPKSFTEAMRLGESEWPSGPLEHSSEQPLGTPEFDHINYEERRRKYGNSAA